MEGRIVLLEGRGGHLCFISEKQLHGDFLNS